MSESAGANVHLRGIRDRLRQTTSEAMNRKDEFGQIIRTERRRMDLTQAQLGAKVGVSDSYVAHIEGGLKTPSLDIAMALSDVFGYTLPQQRALLDALDAARVRRSERRIRVRGRAIREALRTLGHGGSGAIMLMDPDGGATTATIPTSGRRPQWLTFSRDGERVAGLEEDGTTTIWDVERAERVQSVGRSGIMSVALSDDGGRLVSADDQGHLVRWDVDTGQVVGELEIDEAPLASVAAAGTGSVVAAGDEAGRTLVWRAGETRIGWQSEPQPGVVTQLRFTTDGDVLAAGDDSGAIRLWRVATGAVVATMTQPAGVTALAFSQDGALLSSGDASGEVGLWDSESGQELRVVKSRDGITHLAFTPDGVTLFGLDDGGTVTAWDTRTGKIRRSFALDITQYATCALSPDGNRVAAFDAAAAAAGEYDADQIARDLASDRQLLEAWRDLRTALDRPQMRDAVLTALRAFARSKE
jgi:transcriptional regulator with XRE-family HTH domain